MFSNSIRDYTSRNTFTPAVLFKHDTPASIINITQVEAVVSSKLEPIEWISLAAAQQLHAITRVEILALTGFSLELIEDTLDVLLESGLLNLIDYDADILQQNIDRLIAEFGSEWMNAQVTEITNREYVKQYSISKKGATFLKKGKKEIHDVLDLDMIVTANPFKLVYEKVTLKHQSYEEIDVSVDFVNQIMHLAVLEGDKLENRIHPVAIGGDSVVTAFEIVSSQFWLAAAVDAETNVTEYVPYITSSSFIRWANPELEDLVELTPFTSNLKNELVSALSNYLQMKESVIFENLQLHSSQKYWEFTCDLEMQKLLRMQTRTPIESTTAELTIRSTDDWDIIFLVRVLPFDDLAERSLFAARLHSRVDRTGFTNSEGYATYMEIMREMSKTAQRDTYEAILQTLIEVEAIHVTLPTVKSIVIDLNDFLGKQQRRSHPWIFNRIQQLEQFLTTAEIKQVYYYAPKKILSKIDDKIAFEKWRQKVNLEIVENMDDEIPESMIFAALQKHHYIGRRIPHIKHNEELRIMRIERRGIPFSFDKKLQIANLEPIYHWYPVDIINKLYHNYYELK